LLSRKIPIPLPQDLEIAHNKNFNGSGIFCNKEVFPFPSKKGDINLNKLMNTTFNLEKLPKQPKTMMFPVMNPEENKLFKPPIKYSSNFKYPD